MTSAQGATDAPPRPSAGGRLIIANLDCEQSWAGSRGHPLPLGLRRELAALGSLLRVFARPGDALWTPLPLEATRLASDESLPLPDWRSGPWPTSPPPSILAWGESAAVAALRRKQTSPASTSTPDAPTGAARDREMSMLVDRLWALPAADPAAAARVNHRLFQLELAQRLGVSLPGAGPVDTLPALERAVARLPPAAAGRWVLKAPWSAGGRGRVLGGAPDAEATRRERGAAERLLARHGSLLFEPWLPRSEDLGCCVLLADEGPTFLGTHRLSVTSSGGFRAITLAPRPALPNEDEARLRGIAEQVADALHAQGYRGPFGLDAWRYRDERGRVVLHPFGEVNARMTFGLLARAYAERLAIAGRRDNGFTLRLDYPRASAPGAPQRQPAPAHALPLLRSLTPAEWAAWIELA